MQIKFRLKQDIVEDIPPAKDPYYLDRLKYLYDTRVKGKPKKYRDRSLDTIDNNDYNFWRKNK